MKTTEKQSLTSTNLELRIIRYGFDRAHGQNIFRNEMY